MKKIDLSIGQADAKKRQCARHAAPPVQREDENAPLANYTDDLSKHHPCIAEGCMWWRNTAPKRGVCVAMLSEKAYLEAVIISGGDVKL